MRRRGNAAPSGHASPPLSRSTSHLSGVPARLSRSSSYLSGTPTHLQRSSSYLSGTPTHLQRAKSPTHAARARSPTHLARLPRSTALGRSQSFADFRPRPAMGSPGPPDAWAPRPVLGDLLRSPKLGRRHGNATLSTPPSARALSESFRKAGLKLPKVPRPQRTITVFHSLKRGIKECIQATEEDVRSLRLVDHAAAPSIAQARAIEVEKQIRAAERYRKRLEFHLTKVEELEEQYFIHQQLREGVKTMAKAYVNHKGTSQRDSLSNVKTGFKECTQILCAVEAQLQNLMGTFHCQMKGLLGFARLIPGDVYEISVRHGHQKWKSRGRIGEGKQTWDKEKFVFKAQLGDVLDVKAVEVKLLGAKHSLLGQKRCETKDLFSSNPQMMTVSINPHGTIKLSVFVSWNPLEGVEEGINVFEPLQRSPSTASLKRTNYPVIEGYHFAYLNNGDDASSLSGGSDCSSPSPSSPPFFRRSLYPSTSTHSDLGHYARPRHHAQPARPVSVAVMDTISELDHTQSADFGIVKPDVFSSSPLRASLQSSLCMWSSVTSLEAAVSSLRAVLEDYQGQYEELQGLEETVHTLYTMVRGGSSRCSSGSRMSGVLGSAPDITIETALGAFDFLESDEYYQDGYGSQKSSRRPSLDQLEEACTLSPESTTKTADSGIESIANRLSEDCALEGSSLGDDRALEGSSLGSSPEPVSTGNEQVDTALLWHLAYCERLLENLGSFGPLKCREIYALDRLKRQAELIDRLLRVAQEGSVTPDIQQVMTEMTRSKDLRQFWVRCVDGPVLYTSVDRLMGTLHRTYGDLVAERYEIDSMDVFEVFLARMLDFPMFDPAIVAVHPHITVHQLMSYVEEELQLDLREAFQQLAAEMWLSSRLKSGNTDIIIKTMLTFSKDAAPPADCLRIIALLLIIDNAEVRRSAASYLRSLNNAPQVRDKVLVTYVEALEDKNPDLRSAACIALRLIQGSEAVSQLVYLSQTDDNSVVKHAAKDTLLSFGEEGRRAYEESQLTSHGFQGVKVRL